MVALLLITAFTSHSSPLHIHVYGTGHGHFHVAQSFDKHASANTSHEDTHTTLEVENSYFKTTLDVAVAPYAEVIAEATQIYHQAWAFTPSSHLHKLICLSSPIYLRAPPQIYLS